MLTIKRQPPSTAGHIGLHGKLRQHVSGLLNHHQRRRESTSPSTVDRPDRRFPEGTMVRGEEESIMTTDLEPTIIVFGFYGTQFELVSILADSCLPNVHCLIPPEVSPC